MKFAILWLGGTYVLFLLSPYRDQATDVPMLTIFIVGTIVAFMTGYALGVHHKGRAPANVREHLKVSDPVRAVILIGGAWFIAYGLASLQQFGATGLGDIIQAAMNPGDSYRAKFEVFEELQAGAPTSIPLLITSWTGVFFALFIPFLIFYWRALSAGLRIFAVLSLLPYLAFYVYIGTIKGIGDLLIIAIASVVACFGLNLSVDGKKVTARAPSPPRKPGRFANVFLRVAAVAAFLVIVIVMLGGRALSAYEGAYVPVVSEFFGDNAAAAFLTLMVYPTNGYMGLSQSLSIPFVFSGGASMPVFAPILGRLTGVPDPIALSYPVRNEALNGWSSSQNWSTAYASIASDVTFVGAIAAMLLLGWLLARFWIGVRRYRDPLSLALFSLLMFVLVYIPANNQIFLTRYTATGLLTLVVIWILRGLRSPKPDALHNRAVPTSRGIAS